LIAENDALGGTISDGYLSYRLTVPTGLGDEYFWETIVRGFYSIRFSSAGGIAISAEANPSQIFASTPDGVWKPANGQTVGIHLDGPKLTLYLDGENVLEVSDNSRLEGILLRFRVTNRQTEAETTFLMDDFAYWDLSQ
jgi:hypothetical protein